MRPLAHNCVFIHVWSVFRACPARGRTTPPSSTSRKRHVLQSMYRVYSCVMAYSGTPCGHFYVKCQYWGNHPPKHEKKLKKIKISPTPTPGPSKDRYDRGIRVPLAPRGARPIDFYTFECSDTEKVPRGTFSADTAGRRGSCTHFAASSTSHPRGPLWIGIVEPTTEYGGQRVAGNRLLYF